MQKNSLLTLFTILCLSFSLQAQDSTATDEGKLTISGYVDTYYFKNLNNPLSGQNWGSSGFERVFDANEGQFQLGLVQTKFGYTTKKSDMVIDLTFGQNSDLGNYGNFRSLNVLNVAGPITSTALAIKQAYWTYKFSSKFSATAGLFGTHIGYEVIDAPVNFNYSLSNLFANGPFYHTGIKANYAASDKVGFMLGLVNNWDNTYDNNRYKTVIAQIFLSPADKWNIYLNFIGGNENTPTPATGKPAGFNAKDVTKSNKMLFDLTTGYQLTDKFFVGFNGAYGFVTKMPEPTATNPKATTSKMWGGAAVYTNFAFSDVFALGARVEYFDNTQAIQYLVNKQEKIFETALGIPTPITKGTDVTSITLTGNITLAGGHLLLKPEIRMDAFKKFAYTGPVEGDIQQLQDSNGNYTKNAQTTIGMAGIYKF